MDQQLEFKKRLPTGDVSKFSGFTAKITK